MHDENSLKLQDYNETNSLQEIKNVNLSDLSIVVTQVKIYKNKINFFLIILSLKKKSI